ncbi:hypothetical protein Tco_0129593 [Tanacetum coccineum]
MRSIISMVSISLEGFLPSILLLVVIIVTVVIVAVILVVVVVAIVGVVVVVGVSAIIKLSFVIIGFLRRIVFYYLLHQPLGYGNGFLQSLRYEDNRMSDPIGGLEFLGSKVPQGLVHFLVAAVIQTTEVSVSFGDEIFSKGLGKMLPGEAGK